MTISTTTNRVTYTGTGANTALAVPFKFYDSSDLTVTSRVTATGVETTMTISTNYTVTGGNGSTGTVTVVLGATVFPTSVTWTIVRSSPLTQGTDVLPTGGFDADSLEAQLDKLVLQVQDLQEQLDRCLKLP